MSDEKVALGRYLFYDTRLSVNQKQSCATCHRQELAFTDGKPRAVGTTGATHPRASMTLVNVAYVPLFTWSNPTIRTLEDQMAIPLFGEHPIEMGLQGHEEEFIAAIRQDKIYKDLFPKAFPGSAPFTMKNAIKAIAAFERTIISTRAPYDRYRAGDPNALSESAKEGLKLFNGRLGCGMEQCHSDWTFTGAVRIAGGQEPHVWYANTGLYETSEDPGLNQFTQARGDRGKFRPPTLRNVALTAPYMHDGSIATLAEVIDHYAKSGRMNPPNKTRLLRGFQITAEEKQFLIEFLTSLTDAPMTTDPRWSNPW